MGEEKLNATFANDSKKNIDYSFMIYLEKKVKGYWYKLAEKVGYADVGTSLEPHMRWQEEVNLDNREETHSGVFKVYQI